MLDFGGSKRNGLIEVAGLSGGPDLGLLAPRSLPNRLAIVGGQASLLRSSRPRGEDGSNHLQRGRAVTRMSAANKL